MPRCPECGGHGYDCPVCIYGCEYDPEGDYGEYWK